MFKVGDHELRCASRTVEPHRLWRIRHLLDDDNEVVADDA